MKLCKRPQESVNNAIIGFVLSLLLFSYVQAEDNIEQYKQSRRVVVDTKKAELCFADTQDCHKVLIGKTTPKGYGGEIIGFKEEKDFLFALHRVWLGKPSERRQERIVSDKVSDRIMTNGCINVSDAVYEKLREYFVLEVI